MDLHELFDPEVVHPSLVILVFMSIGKFIKKHEEEFFLKFFLDKYSLVPVAVDEVLPDERWDWDISEG